MPSSVDGLLAMGGAAFVSTNIDDLFVLMAFFANSRISPRQVVLGQFIGMGALLGAAVALGLVTLAMPPLVVRLLGVLPLAIGVRQMWSIWRRGEAVAAVPTGVEGDGRPWRQALSVAAVTIANGGDNIGVYLPITSSGPAADLVALAIEFAVLTALWCAAARWFVHHPQLGAPVRRFGHLLLPPVLIGLGLIILCGGIG